MSAGDAMPPRLAGPGDAAEAVVAAPAIAPDRRARLLVQVKAVVEDVAGFEIADDDVATGFTQLGLDSLMFIQIASRLQKAFATRITFRQLMGECAALDRLAEMLDRQLPPEAPPLPEAASMDTPAPPATSLPVSSPLKSMPPTLPQAPPAGRLAADGSPVHRLIEQQLQLMAAQLTLLRSSGVAATPSSVDASVPPEPVSLAASHASVPVAACNPDPESGSTNRMPTGSGNAVVPGANQESESHGGSDPPVSDTETASRQKPDTGQVTNAPSATSPSPSPIPVDYDPFAGSARPRVVSTTEPQREIWLADQLGREASLAFNLSVSLRFRGPLNVDGMRRALQQLVDRHDALRGSVGPDGESFRMTGHVEIPLPVRDLTGQAEAVRRSAIDERVRHAIESPFPLSSGPLFRAELIRVADDEHLLLLTAHHIVCDGWSWRLMVRELGALYSRDRQASRQALPEPVSFADYALAEASHEASPTHALDEAYWLSCFSGEAPVLALPTDRQRPSQRSFASAREDHVLDAALVNTLRNLSARSGASLFSILLTGFAGLLSRLSGQPEVVVGIPAAGQPLTGYDRLVGHCVNLLPLCLDVDPRRPFDRSVDLVQNTLIDALEHQRYTFATLLKKLRLKRDPSRMPLVSALFNLDLPLDREGASFHGLVMEFESNPRAYEAFELFMNVAHHHGALRLECQYNRDLYDAESVRCWLRAFETLLRAAVVQETAEFGSLPLVDALAQAELASLQPAPVAFDRQRRVHEHFEEQCDRTPDRIAVRFGPVMCSYAELEERANRIANLLRGYGVCRGSLVGLAVERGVDMLAALLGVLKAGAGYVPMDPRFPPDRLTYMAADADLAILLTTRELASRFDLGGRPVLALDDLAAALASAASDRIGRDHEAAAPEGIAHVIYTSGSTGRPKGVMVPHRSVANFLGAMQGRPGLSPDDRLLAVTTLSFDIAVLELLLPLSVGAEVVLADHETAGDGVALAALLVASRATVMQATPSTWRLLLDSGWSGRPGFTALCGGEPMPADLARQLLARGVELWNLYGPTETTVWSTCAHIHAPAPGEMPDIHIGRPIDNTTVWVLDPCGQPCPPGVPGEIHIGGDGVTLGYHGRPELTAERFIADRFASQAALAGCAVPARLYRTGDRGRWRHDGVLKHEGRMDAQIKLRGYRIEPGEIEANLASRDEIGSALVIVREDRPNDQRLVAYVVARPGGLVDESALRSHLRNVVPAYMVPQHFIVLDALPLLPNGKVDRNALPPPGVGQPGMDVQHGAATTAVIADPRVHYLIGIWSELLGMPAAADDNFFDLGGHSMLAVQMVNRVARDTGVRIKLIRLAAATLAQVAADLPVTPTAQASPGVGVRIGNGLKRLLGLAAGETRH